MALGPARHSVDLYLDQLTPQQFLVMAYDIAGRLSWNISFISNSGLIAKAGARRHSSTITIRIIDDQIHIVGESPELFDFGRTKKLMGQFTTMFYEVRNTISPEDLAQKYERLEPHLAAPDADILNAPAVQAANRSSNFFSLFLPQKGFFVTPIIIDLNILIWVAMVCTGVSFLEPDNKSLLEWGANLRPLTLEGDWWRLITSTFLHAGIFHLLLNMYALLYIGILLEPYLGKTRFAVAYLLTGVMASVSSLAWHSFTVSVGASGAIFGMYGVFLAMLTTNLIEKSKRNASLASILIFVGYNLFYGTKAGIDNAAHIGGLISGLVIGYLYYPGLKNPDKPRLAWSAMAVATLGTLVITFITLTRLPDDFKTYQEKMKAFIRMEEGALAVLRLPDNTPNEQRLAAIKDTGLYYWGKNLQLVQEIKKLSLPAMIQEKVDTLILYCNLRIASYQFLYRTYQQGGAPTGSDSTAIYGAQINALIEGLKNN
jgi:rhomboid protease GluP